MNAPRLHHVQALNPRGLHRIAYWEWGDAANPRVLVCAHGLTRQGRDFDALAQRLSSRFRVVCPDVAGRGAAVEPDDGRAAAPPLLLLSSLSMATARVCVASRRTHRSSAAIAAALSRAASFSPFWK